jgi:hypothetical protein
MDSAHTRFLSSFGAIAICLALASCSDSAKVSASASGVRLASFKIESGTATNKQLKEGLQSAADVLSSLCAEAKKSEPELKGHLRGLLHVEKDGAVRMFAERDSEFTPAEGKKVSEDFTVATFEKKWQFPKILDDLMLSVDFELQ